MQRTKPAVVGTRVLLRHPTKQDRAEFLAAMRASRKHLRPWIHAPETPERFARYLESIENGAKEGFLVCVRAGGAIAGVINLNEIVRGMLSSAYVGYYATAAHAGQGYMREGLTLVMRYAFGTLRLHRLEANMQPDNRASIALARACGFRREEFLASVREDRWALARSRAMGHHRRGLASVATHGADGTHGFSQAPLLELLSPADSRVLASALSSTITIARCT